MIKAEFARMRKEGDAGDFTVSVESQALISNNTVPSPVASAERTVSSNGNTNTGGEWAVIGSKPAPPKPGDKAGSGKPAGAGAGEKKVDTSRFYVVNRNKY